MTEQSVRPVKDDGREMVGELAHRVLSEKCRIGGAVEHDLFVSQRAPHIIHVGCILDGIVGGKIGTCSLVALDASAQAVHLENLGGFRGQLVAQGLETGALRLGAVQMRSAMERSALFHQHDIPGFKDRTQKIRLE